MNSRNYFFSTRFLVSVFSLKDLPTDIGLEIAFCGRSNSGKSSVLNAITRNKKLAKTSKTPGRTRAINIFSIDMWFKNLTAQNYRLNKDHPRLDLHHQEWQRLL